MNSVNILLVDDDSRNLDVLESILDAPDYRLVRAGSAESALMALMQDDFAVIMLDIRMPDMNGIELAGLIKQRKKNQRLPIIFLTAYYQEDEHIVQGYGAGAVDYLSKPCNPAVLRSKVEVFVDLYRKNRALESEIAERKQAQMLVAQKSEELKSSYQELERRTEQLARMASELTLAEQRERQRLAGLLHDHIQQLLVAASFQLHFLQAHDNGQPNNPVENIRQLLAECLKAARSLTVELSPPILHDGGLVAGLQWLARSMQEKHGLAVEIVADPAVPMVREDVRILLFQSVRELLFNIVKHAQSDKGRVEVSMLPGGDLFIDVCDTGVGFDFEEISKEHNTAPGGFGLFTIRERLTLLAGRFEIISTPGSGARCLLTVPASRIHGANIVEAVLESSPDGRAPAPSGGPITDGARTIRLLLVDDHIIMRQGLAHLLEAQQDFQIIGEASNGEEAVELARLLAPDVILMDCNMPKMDGIQATRIIHSNQPDMRIIGLSMYEESDRGQRMKEAGANQYLTKSGDPEILLAAIREQAAARC